MDAIIEMTGGRGADVCIDAVGMEADRSLREKMSSVLHLQAGTMKTLFNAMTAVRRGGRVSILGVYGTSYDNFNLGQWIDKGLRIQGGQAPVHNYIDELIMLIESGKLRTDDIITHKMSLEDVGRGYQIFNDKLEDCVKVVLKP